jgi:hypothetical protein
LIEEKGIPLPMKPGSPKRYDVEYKRNDMCNLFLVCETKRGWRHIGVTRQRTMQEFAHRMQWLTEVAYPQAEPDPRNQRG